VEAIRTLYERDPAPARSLPDSLERLYDGGLLIPDVGPGGRPYVVANFVATLDGVTSFTGPGQAGGGSVSGFNEADHMVMGLLRAYADAVIFGTGTLHEDSGHVRTAAFVYPPLAAEYAELRRQRRRATPNALNVVVSASGRVNLDEPTFHQPDLHVLIATTVAGAARLAEAALPEGVEVRVIGGTSAAPEEFHPAPGAADGGLALDVSSGPGAGVDPAALLELLAHEYGVRVALHEGGPHLLASFLAAGMLDELFLTLAPQLAGRAPELPRPALLEGHAFQPDAAPWSTLLSLKRAGSHLLLRYALRRDY
jgi:riboflavin biosynthesis pyrimidine reductase